MRRWVCTHCNVELEINFDHVGECPPGGGPFDCAGSFEHPKPKGRTACLLDGMNIKHDDARDANAGTRIGPAPRGGS